MRLHGAIGVAFLVAAGAAVAQPKPAPTAKSDPFAVANWFELQPPSLQSAPPPKAGTLDLGLAPDSGDILVFGHKQKIPPRDWQRQDLGNPRYLEAAGPRDLFVSPRTGCANAAYHDIGGQPATGRDLLGTLGSGDC